MASGECGCNCDFLKKFGIVALSLGIFLTSNKGLWKIRARQKGKELGMVTMTHIEQVSSVHSIPLFSPLDREKKCIHPLILSDQILYLS